MNNGSSIQNPYAGVAIPRAQLKSSFVRNTTGADFDGVVIANPSVVPTYSPQITEDRFSNESPNPAFEGNKIRTQESWRRPYNPYAPDLSQNGGHSSAMYTVDLDRRQHKQQVKEEDPCCCYPMCPCCSCCRKPCCVIS
ncbi:cysteine-rich tail protein 1 [Hyperolius riggenbachi]|uniref:cysteine-rich tail protein 1 n=1 Tax=Hyperolius riggenbachi TaxID=752182 RepID=UPI0035A28F31